MIPLHLTFRRLLPLLGLAVLLLLPGCEAAGKEATFGGDLTGIDHLKERYLSVSNFWLNGSGGSQAGKGASIVCCASLPEKWYPGLTADVRWEVSDWKDSGHGGAYEAEVPVDRYSKPGHIWVHFLANGKVRVVVSDTGPGNPDYPGPHDAIPNKAPWDDYPPPVRRCRIPDDNISPRSWRLYLARAALSSLIASFAEPAP